MSSFSAGEKQANTWGGKWRNRVTLPRLSTDLIGGSCPTIAYLPSKNIIRSAKVAETQPPSSEFGLMAGETSSGMIACGDPEATAPLTHVEALEVGHLPEHLIMLGGATLAQRWRRIPMSREPCNISAGRHRGATFGRERKRRRPIIARASTFVATHLKANAPLKAAILLVAVGHAPNTQGIGLDAAAVKLDARGYIVVNERLETTAGGVS